MRSAGDIGSMAPRRARVARRRTTVHRIMTTCLLLLLVIAALAVATAAAAEEPTSLLRGGPDGGGDDIEDIGREMEALRRLLQTSSSTVADTDRFHNGATFTEDTGATEGEGSNGSGSHSNSTAPSQWNHWHTSWSILSDGDLAALAYDASPLDKEAHRAWGAAYVAARKVGKRLGPRRERDGGMEHVPIIDRVDNGEGGESNTGFLRGNAQAGNENEDRSLQWTQHTGNDVDPMGGLSFADIEMHSASAIDEESEEEKAEWLERLNNAVEVTQGLKEKYGSYDTNEQYTYSDPGGTTTNNDKVGSNGGAAESVDQMQQFSHTSETARQRLLTGSYAAWQWYDRSNLASPTNLNLRKVSRVNYAFFQTNAEGYVFGTDSWADPNVLFGPYEFATTSDRLPEECKGGNGRDDGKDGATLDDEVGASQESAGRRRQRHRRRRAQTTLTTDEDTAGDNPFNTGATCEYFEQCHRNFPNSKSCNIHKYKEGLIYRAHASGAQIYPSIGGWTLSGSFPTVAASNNGRKRFARECVGLIADYGFDGIDIDWEYPGYEPHGGSPRDRENFNKLLLEVREALNDYQIRTGDAPLGGGAFGLTAALPCGPANIDFLDVPFVSRVLDGMNLMTFDFHNELEKVTGVNSPLFDQEWDDEPGLSVDGCVKNYYEGGAGDHAEKISIGIPFYGKTFAFATELNGCHSNTGCRGGGMVDQDNWPQDLGTPVYYNILDRLGRGGMVSKRHEPTKTQYAYFTDGSGLVTYDDPQAVCNKVEYVNLNLLGGVFVWEMSGDLMENRETPLLDAINRKLEETNFDCRGIASPEDGAVVALPPPSPKGPSQVERRDDENVVTSIIDHLNKAEGGELVSGGGGAGAFTRVAFMYRTFDGRLFPSYVYRYEHFVDALRTMSTVGIDGKRFYLGYGQDETEALGQRALQASSFGTEETGLGPTDVAEKSLVYGLVNIAAYLAQAMTESIIHDACDELSTDYLPDDDTDRVGLDDGKDVHRFPISNSCGQHGRSYQTEHCNAADYQYDCVTQMNVEELNNMEAHGISRGHWGGAPGPFYCGPKDVYGSTGFWDAMVGREIDDVPPTANDNGRTDVEGCCWWGRGSLSIKGTCLYGKLNYHIGKNKADRDGPENAMFPDVDFCRDPGQICTGFDSVPLRWITGMYHWMENVQTYRGQGGWNYQDELVRYVNGDLVSEEFFNRVTNVHVLGCHQSTCGGRTYTDYPERLRAFEKVLALFGLQFGSHADPEPPFRAFPGQQVPTPPPTPVAPEEEIAVETTSPTQAPIQATESAIVPVNVYLTGVPDGKNMTNDELQVFESLMFDLLVPRLDTVDVNVIEVITDSQIPNPEVLPESDATFDSQQLAYGDDKSVLQLVMNVTISYNPPPPEGMRDWSIYIKSWIESFGNTMVEIFTSPKHIQHPQTTSKFWDDLVDVSASNVHPPNTEPTGAPTPAPTLIIYPDNSSNTYIYAGVGAGVGLAICAFCICFCYKLREYRQLQAAAAQRQKQLQFEDEEAFVPPQDRAFDSFALNPAGPLEKVTEEDSYESDGSGSSEDDSSSSSGSSSDSESSDEETEYTNEDTAAKSRSFYSNTTGDENDESAATMSREEESTSTYDNTANSGSFVSEDSSALRARDYAMEENVPRAAGPNPADKEMSQFDGIVERVEANDPTLKQVVLDERKQLIGHQHSAESLWNALVGNTYVERLSLRSCNMTDEECASLSLALVDNTSITHVWLGDNDITNEGVEYLIATLESNQTIVYLELAGNPGIDPDLEDDVRSMLEPRESLYKSEQAPGVDEVAALMERVRNDDPTLTELDLRHRGIGTRDDAMSIFDCIASNTHVTRVDLSSNEIDDDCASSLSLALLENRTVTHLNLSNNSIFSEGAEYLIGTLDTNKTLVEINLSRNNMIDHSILEEINEILEERADPTMRAIPTSSGNLSLASVLHRLRENDPSLTELKLSGTDLSQTPETDDLVDALAFNTSVTTLTLDNTSTDDTLAASLSLALADNQSITSISLRDNQITSEGAEYLLGTLDTNTTITHIDLSHNYHIDDQVLREIESILSSREPQSLAGSRSSRSQAESTSEVPLSNFIQRIRANDPTLTEVNLDGRQLADTHEAEAIFDALASNSVVTKVSLGNNGIDDSLVAAFSLALVENQTITSVLLHDNYISSEGCEYLLGTLDSNTTVSYVDLSGNDVSEQLMKEIDAINQSRGGAASVSSSYTSEPTKVESNVDMTKPPMHEVPEESDAELAKRKAIMSIMKDASIPWQEKNQRILEVQQQYFVPKDGNGEPPQAQAAAEGSFGSVQVMIDRVFDNDHKLNEIVLDGQELSLEDQTALFEALALNNRVTFLSLVNCRITNEGAAELTKTLKKNSTLTSINLEDNQITSNAAMDFISVLKEDNDAVQSLELKDNRVRLGVLSQLNKLLEKRRPGYVEPEPVMAATAAVATASYAPVAPVTADVASSGLDESERYGSLPHPDEHDAHFGGAPSGSRSKGKKSKSKSRRR